MAIPKPDPREYARANARELLATDREVLAMLRGASKEVNAQLAALVARDSGLISDGVRRAQLEQTRSRLLAKQGEIFERLGDIVAARRARAAARAQRLSAAADAALLALVGKGAEAQYLYEAALNASQRAIDAALARMRLSELPLAERIYRSSVWMNGRLSKMINETLAAGLNAREFAKKARDWFSPNTPGGVRYAAMRLARTEINNSFHAMSAAKYAETPWIDGVDWNLSGSHPVPDECNPLAEASPYEPDEVPARPHPECMCNITSRSVDEDEFVENFLKGDYDDYLDKELEAKGWDVKEDAPKPVAAPKAQVARVVPAVPNEPVPAAPVANRISDEVGEFVEGLVRVDGDGRAEIVEELKAQAALTPSTIRKLSGVSKMTTAEERALKSRFGNDAIGGYTSESRSIAIAKEVFTDKYERQFTKEVNNGFLSKCPHGHKHDGLKSFIAHEYGHHVEEVIRFGGNTAVKSIWKTVGAALGITPPSLTDKKSLDRWVAKNKVAISKKISKYGAESGGELLAEVWAEYSRSPEPRPEIKAIGDAIRKAAEGDRPTPESQAPVVVAPAVSKVRQALDSGIVKENQVGGGAIAATDMLETNSGVKLIRKKAPKLGGPFGDPARQQDSEEIVSKIMRALGVNAPEVIRTASDEIVMDFREGVRVGAEVTKAERLPFRKRDDAWIIAMVDDVIMNSDRNPGNWLLGDDIVPIDHANSWSSKMGSKSQETEASPDFETHYYVYWNSPFWLLTHNKEDGSWKDNDLSPSDINTFRERLEALRPEFDRLGRLDWLDLANRRLTEFAKYAKGKKDRIK